MEVTHYWFEDEKFRQVKYWSYNRLAELRLEYRKLGHRTWMNLWNDVGPEWILTIQLTGKSGDDLHRRGRNRSANRMPDGRNMKGGTAMRTYGFWRRGNWVLLDGKKEGMILGYSGSSNGYDCSLHSYKVLLLNGEVVTHIPLTTDLFLGKGYRKINPLKN